VEISSRLDFLNDVYRQPHIENTEIEILTVIKKFTTKQVYLNVFSGEKNVLSYIEEKVKVQ
jgi:hypothetical protein